MKRVSARERACLQFDIIQPIKRTEIICHSSSADRILQQADGLPDFLTVKLQSGSIVPRLRKEAALITPPGQQRKYHLLKSTSSSGAHCDRSMFATPALVGLNPQPWKDWNCIYSQPTEAYWTVLLCMTRFPRLCLKYHIY